MATHTWKCDCTKPCTSQATAHDLGIPELRRDYTVPDRVRHEALVSAARHEAWVRGELKLCSHRWV